MSLILLQSFDDDVAPSLASISVTPGGAVVAGATVQFTATGTYSDSSTSDLTSSATWSSSAPSIATVDSAGRVTGVVGGGVRIVAAFDSTSGGADITVVGTNAGTGGGGVRESSIQQNEAVAVKRTLKARVFDSGGNALSLGHTFTAGDLIIVQPDGTVANALTLPVAVAGAADGSFDISIAQSEVQQIGALRVQLDATGVQFLEWVVDVEAPSNTPAIASAVVAAFFAFVTDELAPEKVQTFQQQWNYLLSVLGCDADGLDGTVGSTKDLGGTKHRSEFTVFAGKRTFTLKDGT